jgi:hypothetical protein
VRGETYICTLRSATVADGDGGVTSTDRAMKPATNETTVVKKPKTFWPRTRAECIVAVGLSSRIGFVDGWSSMVGDVAVD